MTIALTPEQDRYIESLVQGGSYASPAEVVDEALRLLGEHDRERATAVAEFNAEMERRLAALDRGEYLTPDEAKAYLQERRAERLRQRA